jgi:hypothetical protein
VRYILAANKRVFSPEDGGDMFLCTVGSYKNYTSSSSYPRRQHFSIQYINYTPLEKEVTASVPFFIVVFVIIIIIIIINIVVIVIIINIFTYIITSSADKNRSTCYMKLF